MLVCNLTKSMYALQEIIRTCYFALPGRQVMLSEIYLDCPHLEIGKYYVVRGIFTVLSFVSLLGFSLCAYEATKDLFFISLLSAFL